MMNIAGVIAPLEALAPPSLQESYDNCGLITGNPLWECTGVLCTLDVTEAVLAVALNRNCNLIVAHHPIIFSGIKKLTGKNEMERTVIAAIKNDLAIYAIHTNLDNIQNGVNGRMADKLGLINRQVLVPRAGVLKKLYFFVPTAQANEVRQALFEAGAGHIGNYSECSFSVAGQGTYRAGPNTNPFAGEPGKLHEEPELRIELVFPAWLQQDLIKTLIAAHPYEEVAYDILTLDNELGTVGSGLLGNLEQPMEKKAFLNLLKSVFGLGLLRHTRGGEGPIQKVALCGGAGSFLRFNALSAGADAYITADLKYHEFFDAEDRLLLCDIGHYESEQFTVDLLTEFLQQKFPTFAVLKSDIKTNPVYYC